MSEKKNHPCEGCCYAGYLQGSESYTCDYILIERKRRGCPAGEECKKKRIGPYIKSNFRYGEKDEKER